MVAENPWLNCEVSPTMGARLSVVRERMVEWTESFPSLAAHQPATVTTVVQLAPLHLATILERGDVGTVARYRMYLMEDGVVALVDPEIETGGNAFAGVRSQIATSSSSIM